MPDISVIVAVYNAEKTLRRCIDSIVKQSLQNIEIILVDDGSTDGSSSICDCYAKEDSRIHVFHKTNEGVARTKQFGLDKAIGTYIVYLDSDDYVALDMYSKLYSRALNDDADIVCCDIMRIEKGGAIVEGYPIPSFEHEAFLNGMIDVLFGSISNRIVRRSLFEEYNVRFNPEISYGEDKLVWIELLSKALAAGHRLKISYIPEALWFYDTTANPSSLMKLKPEKKLISQIRLWKEMGQFLDLRIFGETYYQLLVKHGFKNYWNQTVPKEMFQEVFSPMIPGIKQYAPTSPMKTLVLWAASGKWEFAKKMKWIAAGRILSDRMKIRKEKKL